MISSQISGISIKAVSCALPVNKIASISRIKDFGEDAVNRIISKTGVKSIYKSSIEQTASDLAYVAAKQIIDKQNIDPKTIGALILVTQTPDYRLPATANVLQHRLGVSEDCICFDINLGCSGYVNGLYTIASLMKNSNITRAFLLVAETPTKRISTLDRSLSMIFGDCGTATLLEVTKKDCLMNFSFKTFGDRFKKIIVPAGAYRNLNALDKKVEWGDGNIRSDYETYMNGHDVFNFTISEVPKYLKYFMTKLEKTEIDYDYFVLHQANQYILKQIGKKIKTSEGKIPISMIKYGNTSSTSIPLVLAYMKEKGIINKKKCLMSGFGVGLSWAAVDLIIDMDCILPIIHTDKFYSEGTVSHD